MNRVENWSIVKLNAELENGTSPVRIVEDCLDRILAQNSTIKALAYVDAASALAASQQAECERRMGRTRSPLHGVPIVVTDNIDVEGWPTTAGPLPLDGYIAQKDASCVANLKAAGAVILGKANLHDRRVWDRTDPLNGDPINLMIPDHGTSSSFIGSAAAVAARFCIAAVGTNGGESLRAPTAETSLVSFKPTAGLISMSGVRSLSASFDTVGSLTTTVADARLMTDAMAGRKLPVTGYATRCCTSTLVLGIAPNLYLSDLDPPRVQAFAAYLDRLKQSGTRIVEISLDNTQSLVAAERAIYMYEFASEYRSLIARHPERVEETAQSFYLIAEKVSQSVYQEAMIHREQSKQDFHDRMREVDALLVPMSAGSAPRVVVDMTWGGKDFPSSGFAGHKFRSWANILDMPALTIPVNRGEDLLASIQLATQPGADAPLLDIASALSSSLPNLAPYHLPSSDGLRHGKLSPGPLSLLEYSKNAVDPKTPASVGL